MGLGNMFKVAKKEREPGKTRRTNEKAMEQQEKNRKQFQNGIFIPLTRNGRLNRLVQNMEDGLNFDERVKYIQRPCANIGDILMKKDPWEIPCGREEVIMENYVAEKDPNPAETEPTTEAATNNVESN